MSDKLTIGKRPNSKGKSFNSWEFLVPPSQIYLLINDTAHTIALYSTVKCDGVYHVSFISRYMC